MSEKGKKIAKWLGIVLEVCLAVGLALCVINGSVLDYCLRHLKSIVFILIYLLVPIFLYLKKYADIWKIVVLLGFVCFVNALYNYCGCGDDGDIIVAPLISFIFATPIVFIYGGIIAFKRYVKKDEIGQTTYSFLYVFGAIWAVLLVFVVLGYLRAKPVGVDDTVTTPEMLKQVELCCTSYSA